MGVYVPAWLAVFGVAFGLALILTPVAIRLGRRWSITDAPRGRHQHRRVMVKFGGFALWIAFTGAALFAQVLPVERADPNEVIRLAGLLIGGVIAFALGVLDDKRELGPIALYVGQIVAAAVAVLFLIFIEYFNNPLTGDRTPEWPHWFTVTISLFWLGLMMNTVNFIDGADGLAAGVVCIASLVIFINSVFRVDEPQVSFSLLPLALAGATAGFLVFNFHPARIFLGGGAFLLGFQVGALSIMGGAKAATTLFVMGLPLLDLGWQVVNRLRQGRNPLHGDRGHLHFRLVDIGLSQRVIVLGYYAFCALFGVLTLITASSFFKLAAILVMGGLVAVGFLLVARRQS